MKGVKKDITNKRFSMFVALEWQSINKRSIKKSERI
jgi:hypothetical protein